MGDVLTRSRRLAFVFANASVAGALLACEAILNIEEKPLRVAPEAGALPDGVGVDGGGADARCDPAEPRCSVGCLRDFCDDFDVDGQAPEARWAAPPGFVNPVLKGDSGVSLATGGSTPPAALLAATSTTEPSSFSMLGHQLSFRERHAGEQIDGLRVAIDLRVDTLTYTGPGGPVPDAGSATMLGVLRNDSFPPKGIAILVTGDAVYLDISEDVLGNTSGDVLAPLNTKIDIGAVLQNWGRLELFIGDRERAVAEGHAQCGLVAPGLVAAASLGGRVLGEACAAVPPSFGPASWIETPALLVGSLLFAPGSATFRIDNVVANFYVK